MWLLKVSELWLFVVLVGASADTLEVATALAVDGSSNENINPGGFSEVSDTLNTSVPTNPSGGLDTEDAVTTEDADDETDDELKLGVVDLVKDDVDFDDEKTAGSYTVVSTPGIMKIVKVAPDAKKTAALLESGEKNVNRTIMEAQDVTDNKDNVSKDISSAPVVAKQDEVTILVLQDVLTSVSAWPQEEWLCRDHTLAFLRHLNNYTLWAVAMWEATALEPRGALHGSKFSLGNYDQCLRPAWTADAAHAHLTAQYCLAEVRALQPTRNVSKYSRDFSPYQFAGDVTYNTGDLGRRTLDAVTWGACAPASCSARSVRLLLEALLRRSSLEPAARAAGLRYNVTALSCQRDTSKLPLPTPALAFYMFCLALIGIVVACSATHLLQNWLAERSNKKIHVPQAVMAFSALKNFPALARRSQGSDDASGGGELQELYAVRYLSCCLIVACHRYVFYSMGALSNGSENDQFYQNPGSMVLIHADLLVDTFFFMAALLVTRALLTADRFPNFLLLLLKRYMRLAPGLAMVILYISTAYASAGDGPLWPRWVAREVEHCRKNWWLNLLMVSNYIRVNEMCYLPTWYVAIDFHMFAVCAGACWLLRRRRTLGIAAWAALALAALAAPAAVTVLYRLPAVQLFYHKFFNNPRGDDGFIRFYIPTHTRAGAYVVGMAAGYLCSRTFPIATTKKIKLIPSIVLILTGGVVMVGVMYTGCLFYEPGREYSAIEAAIYSSLNRPAWAVGLAMLLASFVYGTLPFVPSIMRWSVWVPLGKLSYGLYLTDMLVIARDLFVARDPQLSDVPIIIHRITGDIVWGTVGALALWLLVEAPCTNLLKICLAPRSRASVRPSSQESLERGSSSVEQETTPPASDRRTRSPVGPTAMLSAADLTREDSKGAHRRRSDYTTTHAPKPDDILRHKF